MVAGAYIVHLGGGSGADGLGLVESSTHLVGVAHLFESQVNEATEESGIPAV